jgi:predicted esterase
LLSHWIPVLIVTAFVTGLFWAHSRDLFKRVEFSIPTAKGGKVTGIVVLPRPIRPRPMVIYLHGYGRTWLTDGNALRLIAEQGLAAVSLEYDQNNKTDFDEQFAVANEYFRKQSWAMSNAIVWVGVSQGAQYSFSFLLNHPELQPQLYVQMSGGWVPELDATNVGIRLAALHCRTLLIHGENDGDFPAADCRKLAALLNSNNVSTGLAVLPGQLDDFSPNFEVIVRGAAEYCASLFGPIQPLPVNTRSLHPLYWAPFFCVVVFLTASGYRRHRAFVRSTRNPHPSASVALMIVACILGLAAAGETVIHLGMPFLKVSEATAALSRRWIVRPAQRDDCDWLIAQPFARHQELHPLLQNLELADLQKKFFFPALTPEMYRDYVLSPVVSANLPNELGWRRELWESLYPRIRHENDPFSAAQIVTRFLRDRVTVVPGRQQPARGLVTMWKQGLAEPDGFEALCVAALRATGIPSRLNGKAEFWNGASWQPAPRPAFGTVSDFAGNRDLMAH